MKFLFNISNKTPLYVAIEKRNDEIAKLLLKIKEIDVNIKSIILIKIFFINQIPKYNIFNSISKYIFLLMTFQPIFCYS